MDNDFLQEMAAEVLGDAIQDQPLSYVEVVAEYEDEHWYLLKKNMIFLNKFRGEILLV